MNGDSAQSVETIELSRLTAASLLDYLTDYQAELERAEAEGSYTEELRIAINQVVTVIEESNNQK